MSDDPQKPIASEAEDVKHFIQQLYLFCPRIIVIPSILTLNILVFVFLLTQGAGIWGDNLPVYIEHGANLGALTKDNQWWRLLTAMFLHYGIPHLLINMWALWDAGRLTERLFGHTNFAWIYLFTGLFASLSSLYWNLDDVASVGASGAVFGVFGAMIGYLVRQRHIVPRPLLRQLMKTAVLFTGLALLFGFLVPAIDNAAHVGGLVSGLLMGLLLAKPLTHKRPAIFPAMLAHAGSVVILVVAIILAPARYYDYQAQQLANETISGFADKANQLMAEWSEFVELLRQGQVDSEMTARQQLGRMLGDWASLQARAHVEGHIQDRTRRLARLQYDLAGHWMNNIHYMMRYLETGDEIEIQNISNNNTENIKVVLEELNQSFESRR